MTSLQFLLEVLFNLYLMVVLLRLWLQWTRADFYNPFSQFVVKATNGPLRPLRRIIPGWGGFDFASLVLAFIVAFAKISLLMTIKGAGFPLLAISISSVLTVFSEAFELVFWVLIIRAILSWVSQGYNPMEAVLHQLTEPMLAPVRRVIPPLGGLDLSILILLLGLQFFKYLLIQDILPLFL